MRLGVVYHRAFWVVDAALYEGEGAFSRFVEALARHVDNLDILVPRAQTAQSDHGHRLNAPNVELRGLPHWRDLIDFYRALPRMLVQLIGESQRWDAVIIRLPTPLGFWAWLAARLRRVPTLLILVGDLAGVAETVPGSSWKRRLYRIWARVEDRLVRWMVGQTQTLANGDALWRKYGQGRPHVLRTTNSTILENEIARDAPRPLSSPLKLLCVSRIDPRKGIRYLPDVISALVHRGHPVTLTVVGGDVGELGRQERVTAMERARSLGVADAISYLGAQSIERVHDLEREHDMLLVPSLPGEGVPRVIIEAFAAGLPVVATNVAGIPGVVADGASGLLVPPAQPDAMADAVEHLIQDDSLRCSVIEGGLRIAHANTIEGQTETIMSVLRERVMTGIDPESDDHPSPDRSRLRFTIPLAGMNLSGGVKSLLFLANALAGRGHQVRVIVPDYAASSPIALDSGVDLKVLKSGLGPSSVRKITYFARLAIEATEDSDLCLANYFLTTFPSVSSHLLHGRKARLAYNIRGYEPLSHGSLAESGGAGRVVRGRLAKLSFRLPLQKICTTEWLKEMVGDSRAIVIGHGIDLAVFHAEGRAPASTVIRIGVIGRSGDVKGYGDFLASLDGLPPSLPIQIHVAGQDQVAMPGRWPYERCSTPDEPAMAEFYRSCDVFVFPSRAEGFGLPPLEAMACGAAVVMTDCGGVRTYARPEENCLIVPTQDAEAMAGAIRRLIDDAALRRRLVHAGHETANQFSRSDVEERFCDLLESLARAR